MRGAIVVTLILRLVTAKGINAQTVYSLQTYTVLNDVGCINPSFTEAGRVWLRKDTELSTRQKQFVTAVKENHKGRYVNDLSFTVDLSKPPVIALVEFQVQCSAKRDAGQLQTHSYKFYRGANPEDIDRQIASDIKGSKQMTVRKIEFIPIEKELRDWSPTPVLTKYTTMGIRG